MTEAALPAGPTEARVKQALKMGLGIYGYLQQCSDKFGPAFTIHPPGLDPMVWVSGPEMVKDFFNLKPEQLDQSKLPIPVDFGAEAIGFINNEYHADSRKIMLKPLTNNRVTDRADIMLEMITRSIDGLVEGEEYDLTRFVGNTTLDIVTHVLIGEKQGERFKRYRELIIEWMHESCKDSMFLIGTLMGPQKFRDMLYRKYQKKIESGDFGHGKKGLMPWSYAVELKAQLAELIREDVREARKVPDTSKDDMLTRMALATYSDGEPLSEEKIIAEVLAIFIAGYETSAATGGWFGVWLQKHPQVRQQMHDQVIGSIDERGKLDPKAIIDNDFLAACLNESQRLTPSAVGTMRHLINETKIGPLLLPAGTNVLASAYIVHRDPAIWGEDALEFRPERWLEDSFKPGPFEFFPFGGGRRACLGTNQAKQQLRLLFGELARRVEFSSSFDDNDHWPKQQQASGQTVPQGGVPLRVKSIRPFNYAMKLG